MFDLAALDEAADGALYSLRYECQTNGWSPHLWAQTPKEGGPAGLTRVIFIGVDAVGRTKYFDTALFRDTTGMALQVQLSQTFKDAERAAKRLAEGLSMIEIGLDPPTPDQAVRSLN